MPKGKEARFVCYNESSGEQPSKDTVIFGSKKSDPGQVEELLRSREPSESKEESVRESGE
jgi:hypothetical protein